MGQVDCERGARHRYPVDVRARACASPATSGGDASYESFGEDPALVTALAGAAITGLQGTDPSDLSGPDKVLATAKHWVGDGGTSYDPALAGSGYPIDQGITHVADQNEFKRLLRRPVRAGDRGRRRLDHAVVLGGLDR